MARRTLSGKLGLVRRKQGVFPWLLTHTTQTAVICPDAERKSAGPAVFRRLTLWLVVKETRCRTDRSNAAIGRQGLKQQRLLQLLGHRDDWERQHRVDREGRGGQAKICNHLVPLRPRERQPHRHRLFRRRGPGRVQLHVRGAQPTRMRRRPALQAGERRTRRGVCPHLPDCYRGVLCRWCILPEDGGQRTGLEAAAQLQPLGGDLELHLGEQSSDKSCTEAEKLEQLINVARVGYLYHSNLIMCPVHAKPEGLLFSFNIAKWARDGPEQRRRGPTDWSVGRGMG